MHDHALLCTIKSLHETFVPAAAVHTAHRVPAKLAGMLAVTAAGVSAVSAAEGDLWTKVKKGAKTVCLGAKALHASGELANRPAKHVAAVRTLLKNALKCLAPPKRPTPASPPRGAKGTPPSPRRRVAARLATPPVSPTRPANDGARTAPAALPTVASALVPFLKQAFDGPWDTDGEPTRVVQVVRAQPGHNGIVVLTVWDAEYEMLVTAVPARGAPTAPSAISRCTAAEVRLCRTRCVDEVFDPVRGRSHWEERHELKAVVYVDVAHRHADPTAEVRNVPARPRLTFPRVRCNAPPAPAVLPVAGAEGGAPAPPPWDPNAHTTCTGANCHTMVVAANREGTVWQPAGRRLLLNGRCVVVAIGLPDHADVLPQYPCAAPGTRASDLSPSERRAVLHWHFARQVRLLCAPAVRLRAPAGRPGRPPACAPGCDACLRRLHTPPICLRVLTDDCWCGAALLAGRRCVCVRARATGA